ncbi:MAG TPA: hypothetical protein VIS51_00790 [Solirubrobacterales bacterium]
MSDQLHGKRIAILVANEGVKTLVSEVCANALGTDSDVAAELFTWRTD